MESFDFHLMICFLLETHMAFYKSGFISISGSVTCSSCNGCLYEGNCYGYGGIGEPPNVQACINGGGTNCAGTMPTLAPVTCSNCDGCISPDDGACYSYGVNNGPPDVQACISVGGTNCAGTIFTSGPVTPSICDGCILHGSCFDYGYGGLNVQTCIRYGGTNCGGTMATSTPVTCSSCNGCIKDNTCYQYGPYQPFQSAAECYIYGGTDCGSKSSYDIILGIRCDLLFLLCYSRYEITCIMFQITLCLVAMSVSQH